MAGEYQVDPILKESEEPSPAAPNAKETIGDAYSARLYDHDTGKWVEVPAAEVPNRVGSGKFTYEVGVQVPMISPEGERLSIPSENAYDAFKEGFRPVTAANNAVAGQIAEEKLQQAQFANQPLNAGIAGFLRGATLGGSDVVIDAFGAGDAAAQLKNRNEAASMVGEGGGILFSTLYGGPVGAGAKAATKAGVAGVEAALGTGRAASALGRVAGAAAEGAYFGMGQGISEAALGNPDSVVDTLISHAGLGALIGGGVGSVFAGGAAAKPLFDKLVSSAATGSADVVNAAAKKALIKGATPVLERAGFEGAEAKLGDLLYNPEVKKLVSEHGGVEAAEAFARKELEPFVKAAKAEQSAIEADLKQVIKASQKESQQVLEEVLNKSGKNVYQAGKFAEQEMEAARESLLNSFASQSAKPITTDLSIVSNRLGSTVEALRATRSVQATKLANNLEAMQGSLGGVTNQASEANLLYTVGEMLQPHIKSKVIGGEVGKLFSYVDDTLSAHPNGTISTLYNANKVYSSALNDLRSIVDKSLSRTVGEEAVFASDKAFRTIVNPESRRVLDTVLDNLGEFGPEIKQYQALKTGVQDVVKQAEFQQLLENKVKALVPGGRVNVEQVQEIFDLVGKKGLTQSAVARLQELRSTLGAETSTLDKAIAVGKAVGADVKKLEAIAKHSDKLTFYNKLAEISMPSLSGVKAGVGQLVGGPIGLLYGLQKSNLQNYVNSVNQLQAATEKGAKIISKGVQMATSALTSKGAQKGVGAIAQSSIGSANTPNIAAQRARYKSAKTALEAAQASAPISRPEVPNISKVLQQRQDQAIKFLKSKMPEDPFQSTSINAINTGYVPSDFEITKFNRYVDAANDPSKVLNAIAKGNVSAEEVETLKELYPRIYNDLQQSVMSAIIEAKGDISYKQKLALSDLLDIPTDYTLQSDFIGRMQESINRSQGGRPEGSGEAPKTIRNKLDLSPMETLATSTQKLTYKGQV